MPVVVPYPLVRFARGVEESLERLMVDRPRPIPTHSAVPAKARAEHMAPPARPKLAPTVQALSDS
jgi:hypothetical protein